jgi:hypothetical protein
MKTHYYKYSLKFYATKNPDYQNKYFFFNLKTEKEAFSLLYLFALHHNIFLKIYLSDLFTKHNYELPNEVVKDFNLYPKHILDYKSCLC